MPDFEIITPRQDVPATTLPAIRVDHGGISIREARLDDYGFIDDLQKRHSRAVGFMWEKAIKTRIEQGNVLVAESSGATNEHRCTQMGDGPCANICVHPRSSAVPTLLGYVIGVDRYFKRDDVGIIYQLNVLPEYQRLLVGAHLLKAKFERSAYGCRLYCCWCAQDLNANRFWEAMGFVPLAFRTGGGRNRKEGPRLHVFWQKRIRAGDTGDPAEGGTPYWFPSQTGAGAIGEDRLVLPIPPGTHWSDAKPVVLPEGPRENQNELLRLEGEVAKLKKERKAVARKSPPVEAKPKKVEAAVEMGGLHFGTPAVGDTGAARVSGRDKEAEAQAAKRRRAEIDAKLKDTQRAAKAARKKFDPEQEAFARELKDRWLEEVQARPALLAAERTKYDVRRLADSGTSADSRSMRIGEVKRLAA